MNHSLASLAVHLTEIALEQREVERHALEKVGHIIERRAKVKIGEYQAEAGPFAAWAELADSTKADRVRQGYSEDEPGLRSGGMRDSIESTVEVPEVQTGSNDDKLVFFEMGTRNQPPRSVLGGAVVDEMDKIIDTIGHAVHASLIGEGVVDRRMEIIEG